MTGACVLKLFVRRTFTHAGVVVPLTTSEGKVSTGGSRCQENLTQLRAEELTGRGRGGGEGGEGEDGLEHR